MVRMANECGESSANLKLRHVNSVLNFIQLNEKTLWFPMMKIECMQASQQESQEIIIQNSSIADTRE